MLDKQGAEFEAVEIRLADLRYPEDYAQLPKLNHRKIKRLWGIGTYHAIRWIADYEGRKCYLQHPPKTAILSDAVNPTNHYLVVELTPEQWEDERRWEDAAESFRPSKEEREQGRGDRLLKAHFQVSEGNSKRKRDYGPNIVLGWV